jgi:hypothetical protein
MNRAVTSRLSRLEKIGPGDAPPAVIIAATDAAEANARLAEMRALGAAPARAPVIILTGVPRATTGPL